MKTLGSRTAPLVAELYERGRSTFTLADVEAITGLSPGAARSLVSKAVARGLMTRLTSGLFALVPFELGHATHYSPDPYLLAVEAVGHIPYFLSHATAFELQRLTTQPNFTIYVSCVKRLKPKIIGGYAYHFVQVLPEELFGTTKHWVSKTGWVMVSDLERTLVDGLHQPRFAGGIPEVAKGLWMRHKELRFERLVAYALRLDVGAVVRRLGFLLELYELAPVELLEGLRKHLSATYSRLDPTLPPGGRFLARWRLELNVSPEELKAIRFS